MKSFEILGQIIEHEEAALVDMVDTLYMAAYRKTERRLGESVVLSWTVCEQLISIAWRRLLDSKRGSLGSAERINKERRKKLEGRDYTASVISDMLIVLVLGSELRIATQPYPAPPR